MGAAAAGELPDIHSKSAVVLDADNGAEVLAKDADAIRPIASTTKIFVALAVRDKGLALDDWTAITKDDAHEARGGSRTRLEVGEEFRNEDLLRAMLIASDNRAPTALGRAAGMSRDELIDAMNAVAKRLHLVRTKFTDPTGLRGNVSTAREMALALAAAVADDELRTIMSEPSHEVVAKGRRHGIYYGSTNLPLVVGRYDVIGGKTGYTDAAGYCYIAAVRFGAGDGRHVLVMAFLGAEGKLTRFADFGRVSAWIDRGAPGARIATDRAVNPSADVDVEIHGRVAE